MPFMIFIEKREFKFFIFFYVLRFVSCTFQGPFLGRGATCWRGRGGNAFFPPTHLEPKVLDHLALDPNKIYSLIRSKPYIFHLDSFSQKKEKKVLIKLTKPDIINYHHSIKKNNQIGKGEIAKAVFKEISLISRLYLCAYVILMLK